VRQHRRFVAPEGEGDEMKVTVDESLCNGYGLCVEACPEVFALGDADEQVTLLIERPDESLRESVERAVEDCPKTALGIEG
jgi:ferredoxin